MWFLSMLTSIKVPLWLFLIVALAAGGLFVLHKYEANKIDSLKADIVILKENIKKLEGIIVEKDEKILILQESIIAANKNTQEFQNRNTKLIKIISGFGVPVVIPATGKNELNAINKADSDKLLKWLNEEMWK